MNLQSLNLEALQTLWLQYQQPLVVAGIIIGIAVCVLLAIRLSRSDKKTTGLDDSASSDVPSDVSSEGQQAEEEQSVTSTETVEQLSEPAVPAPEPAPPGEVRTELSAVTRFRRGLSKTRQNFGQLFGVRTIDTDLLEELETHLLMADVGVEVSSQIMADLSERVKKEGLSEADQLRECMRKLLLEIITPCQQAFEVTVARPAVIMVVGVNGVGKTTTIGKLANFYKQHHSVLLAAGDTFRAAAVEQLQEWGSRNQVPVIAQHTGADSASVVFDAIEAARARNIDLVIADTAGRLHNKSNLMEELNKVKRVAGKIDARAPHEVLLVLDAGTGQNAISQMQEFSRAVGVTGIVLTKLDGTAKGGVIFPLCKKFGIPIRFTGLGEKVEDLQPFDAQAFVEALF